MNAGKFYKKYIVHSWISFVIFLIIGVSVFLIITTNTKIEVVKTYQGSISGDRVVINEVVEPLALQLYLYKEKELKILNVNAKSFEIFEDMFTIVYLDDYHIDNNFDGMINIDIVCGYTNLLRILTKIDDKYVTE